MASGSRPSAEQEPPRRIIGGYVNEDQQLVNRGLTALMRRLSHEHERDVPISRGEAYALLNELALLVDFINRRPSD